MNPSGQISQHVVEHDNDILSETTEGSSIKLLSLSFVSMLIIKLNQCWFPFFICCLCIGLRQI